MTLTILTTNKPATTNFSDPAKKMLCTNCIYGDYWIDRHIFVQHQISGFDCSYPNIGSRSDRNIDSDLISNDRDIAVHCPKYRLADAID
jgi:hypothetical protein